MLDIRHILIPFSHDYLKGIHESFFDKGAESSQTLNPPLAGETPERGLLVFDKKIQLGLERRHLAY